MSSPATKVLKHFLSYLKNWFIVSSKRALGIVLALLRLVRYLWAKLQPTGKRKPRPPGAGTKEKAIGIQNTVCYQESVSLSTICASKVPDRQAIDQRLTLDPLQRSQSNTSANPNSTSLKLPQPASSPTSPKRSLSSQYLDRLTRNPAGQSTLSTPNLHSTELPYCPASHTSSCLPRLGSLVSHTGKAASLLPHNPSRISLLSVASVCAAMHTAYTDITDLLVTC